jgi:hypothetical protein
MSKMLKEMKYRYFVVLSALLIIGIFCLLAFQSASEGVINVIGKNCFIVNSAISPLDRLVDEPKICNDSERDDFYSLSKIEGRYSVDGIRGTGQSTWFNDNYYRWENSYLAWLAIITASTDFKVIFDDPVSNIIVFSETIGDNLAVWAWHLTPSSKQNPERPQEMKLVDLQAGDQADRDFIEFLKRGNNFQDSRLPELLQEWRASGYQTAHCVRAILPNPCGEEELDLDISKDVPEESVLKRFFDPMDFDKDTPQPLCISQYTAGTSSGDFNLLVAIDNGDSYEVWLKRKGVGPIGGGVMDWYKQLETRSPLYSWLVIALVSRCKTYKIPGTPAIISVCDTTVYCYRDSSNRLEEYKPLELMDIDEQRRICQELKLPSNYERSSIRHLIEQEWFVKGHKYKVISYSDRRSMVRSDSSLVNQLHLTNSEAAFQMGYFLIENKTRGRPEYYTWSQSEGIQNTWYSSSLHRFRSAYLARLALADKRAKLLDVDDSDRIVSFVTSTPEAYLWSWKIGGSQTPREYAPFAEVLDNSGTSHLAFSYAEAYRDNSSLFDSFMREHIQQAFSPNPAVIRQIFPENFPLTPGSPYSLLGVTASEPTDAWPPQFMSLLQSARSVRYLMEEHNGDFAIIQSGGTVRKQPVWFQEISHFADQWPAWLCLADSEVRIVAAADSQPTRICMITGSDRRNLWSWVSPTVDAVAPRQYHLVADDQPFLLSNIPQGDYVAALTTNIPESISDFFLDRADRPESFTLLDWFQYPSTDPDQLLLYRDNDKPDREIYRLANGLSKGPIIPHLVDGEWDVQWRVLAERYRREWSRSNFKLQLANSTADQLAAWFGPDRMGLAKGGLVGVFQSTPNRNFPFAAFSQILDTLKRDHDLVYIPRSKQPNAIPDKSTLFSAWVGSDWRNEKLWRANPLGYFDRIGGDEKNR